MILDTEKIILVFIGLIAFNSLLYFPVGNPIFSIVSTSATMTGIVASILLSNNSTGNNS